MGDMHPNLGPQTHKWVCDICLKLITKHETSILYNYTNLGFKFSRITTNDTAAHGAAQFLAL